MQSMAKQQHAAPVEASQGKSTIFPAICWNTAGMPATSAADALPLPAFACGRPESQHSAAWELTCTAVGAQGKGRSPVCRLLPCCYARKSQIIIARAGLGDPCPFAVHAKGFKFTLMRLWRASASMALTVMPCPYTCAPERPLTLRFESSACSEHIQSLEPAKMIAQF